MCSGKPKNKNKNKNKKGPREPSPPPPSKLQSQTEKSNSEKKPTSLSGSGSGGFSTLATHKSDPKVSTETANQKEQDSKTQEQPKADGVTSTSTTTAVQSDSKAQCSVTDKASQSSTLPVAVASGPRPVRMSRAAPAPSVAPLLSDIRAPKVGSCTSISSTWSRLASSSTESIRADPSSVQVESHEHQPSEESSKSAPEPVDPVDYTEIDLQRREFIKQMSVEAWQAYCTHAWGHGELDFRPNAKWGWFGAGSGYTIVASMPTLYILGLKDEFERARKWLECEFDWHKIDAWVEVSRAVTDYIGALLACHALTGDMMFVEKAKALAVALEPAYEGTSHGLPYQYIHPLTGKTTGVCEYLSMLSAGMLEYRYLTDLTEDATFVNRTIRVRKFLIEKEKPVPGLYPEEMDIESGKWKASISSLFFSGKCWFQNLLGLHLQSGGTDMCAIKQYCAAMDAVRKYKIITQSKKSKLRFARDYHLPKKVAGDFMDYAGCYLGAMLALGCEAMKRAPQVEVDVKSGTAFALTRTPSDEKKRVDLHWQWAREITETGRLAALRTKTGLPPSRFHFDTSEPALEPKLKDNKAYNKEFHLSGELAESYFILYRITHEHKYRDYAWSLADSIYKHCRAGPDTPYPGSYCTVQDVNKLPTHKHHYQSVDLFCTTLKYLYLIFCEDQLMPLEQWIFSSTGQPLPIKGRNQAYKGVQSREI